VRWDEVKRLFAFKKIMEKLELKHLAPYLPYNLKLFFNDSIYSISIDYGIGSDNLYLKYALDMQIKPILRPFRSLDGSGKELMKELNCSSDILHEIWKLEDYNFDFNLNDVTVKTYLVMCKNHIDFNDLIGQRLAVSTHDVKEKEVSNV
jgi:hypothetical protein